jgi:hypothetical protein
MNKETDVPDVLYRGFEVLERARAFVNEGLVYFGWLRRYRDLEDEHRRDQNEGTAELRTPVILENWGVLNGIYVLCCSVADPTYVASKFGRHLVRINNPEVLVADIRDHISSNPVMPDARVYARRVRL